MIVSPHRKHRRAFTLVEMLVVIATTSVVCTLATSLVITMFRAEQTQTRDANERRAIQRLGDQFRGDVHAAEAQPTFNEADDVLLRLAIAGDTHVTYRRAAAVIVREEHHSGAVARHDAFAVSDHWQVSIEPLESDAPGQLVRLSLVRTPAAQRSSASERWHFEATRGSDHRHHTHVNLTE